MLNLEDRNIKEYSEFNNLKMINWDSVEDILIKERNKSIDFLINTQLVKLKNMLFHIFLN